MIRETTPARITQVIIDFCASITSDSSPEYIDVCPASWATPNLVCFMSLIYYVNTINIFLTIWWLDDFWLGGMATRKHAP